MVKSLHIVPGLSLRDLALVKSAHITYQELAIHDSLLQIFFRSSKHRQSPAKLGKTRSSNPDLS